MLIESKEGVLIHVKVIPQAREERIVGWQNEILKLKVRPAPEKGEANEAVIQLLAHFFHLPRSQIHLKQGSKSRLKQFLLAGLTKVEALHFLSD